MNILIKNGHIIDPSQNIDGIGDVLIENGKIIELRVKSSESGVKDNSKLKTQNSNPPLPPLLKGGEKIIDAAGLYVLPGLVVCTPTWGAGI